MRHIKRILFVLLLHSGVNGQTVHIEEDRIVYKGVVRIANISKQELYERAKDALRNIIGGKEPIINDSGENGTLVAKGTMKLTTPYHLIRQVGYILELSVEDGGYKYRIDSVNMKQVERGGKTIKISSAELFKGIEATGPESIEAEKILNEIDLKFQKILALVNRDIKSEPVAISN